MSRTYKDRPLWVKAEYFVPMHSMCENSGWGKPNRKCDLPENPIREHNRRTSWKHVSCYWSSDFKEMTWPSPPKWYIDHVWNNHIRTVVRDECRRAVMEYNGYGEVDVIPNIDQHRNCAKWMWD